MAAHGLFCGVSPLLQRKNTATVRANQRNLATMLVSGRLWTEGKVGTNWGQSEGKSMMMKICSFIYILLFPLPAPIPRTTSHFAGALHTVLKMNARGYPLGTVHRAAVFSSFWLDSVASASTQSAWQGVPKNDTLKNDGTFDGTFF